MQSDAPEPVSGQLALPQRTAPPASDSLLAEAGNEALPDLLAGIVDPEANPTEDFREPVPPPRVGGDAVVIPIDSSSDPEPLVRAPIDALQSRSLYGFVPRIGDDGQTPFEAYKRPSDALSGPGLSIVLGGLGINPDLTARAIEELPPDITLSFAAHAPNLQAQIDRARRYGHEVVLELPMESATAVGDEPFADRTLITGAPVDALDDLDYLLSRTAGYFAVVPYGGDLFLSRTDASAPILEKIAGSGLGFISDPQLDIATLAPAARAAKLRYREGTMLIDEDTSPDAIRRDLEQLTELASEGGRPIGFGFAYPSTIDALAGFSPEGVTLVPASAAFR